MPITYDPLAGDYLLRTATKQIRLELSDEPTLEDAYLAWTFLKELVTIAPKNAVRPDPLGLRRSSIYEQVIEFKTRRFDERGRPELKLEDLELDI